MRRIVDLATLLVQAQSQEARVWHAGELVAYVNRAAVEHNSALNHQLVLLRAKAERLQAELSYAKAPLRRGTVRVLAVNAGFRTRRQPDGTVDLNEYVYLFAERVRGL